MIDQAMICEGIVIGVSSGVVLGIFRWLSHRNRRCKQVRYIRRVIVTGKCETYKEGECPSRVGKDHFDLMCREVRSALQWQSADMSYDQVAELRNLFFRILNPSDSAMDGTITDAKIATCFGMLEDDSFKFLKLERSYHQQVSKQERRRGPVES